MTTTVIETQETHGMDQSRTDRSSHGDLVHKICPRGVRGSQGLRGFRGFRGFQGFRSVAAMACMGVLSAAALAQRPVLTEDRKLTAVDGIAHDQFGISVAIKDGVAVVGALLEDDRGFNAGAVYVIDAITGQHLQKITANDGANSHHLGRWAAFDGATAIVSNDLGEAYLFDATAGQQLHKLTPQGDGFISSGSVSGARAIVGETSDDDGGTNAGAAYVFDIDTGQQLHKLTANDASSFDILGSRVAIDADRAVVSATGNDEGGTSAGAAYVFDVNTGQQLHKLTANDASAFHSLGRSVAISGDLAVVTAPGARAGYIFNIATGQQVVKLETDEANPFGGQVAISGRRVVIGDRNDDDGGTNAGAAYVFDALTGQLLAKLVAATPGSIDVFGESVAIDGDLALIGAPLNDAIATRSGAGYVYDLSVLPDPTPGDANGDGLVDAADLTLLALNWQQPVDRGYPEADFNVDGFVDAGDLTLIALNWQPGAAATGPAVGFDAAYRQVAALIPEPAAAMILFTSGLLLCCSHPRAKR